MASVRLAAAKTLISSPTATSSDRHHASTIAVRYLAVAFIGISVWSMGEESVFFVFFGATSVQAAEIFFDGNRQRIFAFRLLLSINAHPVIKSLVWYGNLDS